MMAKLRKIIKYTLLLAVLIGVATFLVCYFVSLKRADQAFDKLKNTPVPQLNLPVGPGLPSTKDTKKMIRILVLTGGGVHGLVQLKVLKYLEQQSHQPLNKLFDVVGCVSTGCLNTALMLMPNKDGTGQRYTPQQIINLYPSLAQQIFSVPWYYKVDSVVGIKHPLFSSYLKGLVITKYLANLRMKQTLLPVYMCTTKITDISMHCFKSWNDQVAPMYAAPIVNAASSPIIAFYPGVVGMPAEQGIYVPPAKDQITANHVYFDAAFMDNSPAESLLLDMILRYPRRPITLVEIKAGKMPYNITANSIQWSPLKWLENVLPVMYFGHNNSADSNVSKIAKIHAKTIHYFVINYRFPTNPNPLTGDPAVISLISKYGDAMVKANKTKLDEALKYLLQ
jgi:hypothetical protein